MEESASAMMLITRPAVAMPVVPMGMVLRACIAKTIPTTDIMMARSAPQPNHINTSETMPRTSAATALPLPGMGP